MNPYAPLRLLVIRGKSSDETSPQIGIPSRLVHSNATINLGGRGNKQTIYTLGQEGGGRVVVVVVVAVVVVGGSSSSSSSN